jgi:16S rRNA processing protein RimM
MYFKENYFLLGMLTKTHGISGEFVLRLDNQQFEEVPEIKSAFIEFEGLLVPFLISRIYPKASSSLIIKFDDIETEEQALEFVNCIVYTNEILNGNPDNYNSNVASLTGYHVIDQKIGDLGVIQEYLDLSNNPVFRIIKGKKEILIPVNQDFIISINKTQKTIVVNTPKGLIDLYTGG